MDNKVLCSSFVSKFSISLLPSQEFLDTFAREEIVGISNSLPLLIEILMGSFRPKLFKERQK